MQATDASAEQPGAGSGPEARRNWKGGQGFLGFEDEGLGKLVWGVGCGVERFGFAFVFFVFVLIRGFGFGVQG